MMKVIASSGQSRSRMLRYRAIANQCSLLEEIWPQITQLHADKTLDGGPAGGVVAYLPGRSSNENCGGVFPMRAFLSKYDFTTSRTIGAAKLPCSPASNSATTTISGFSRGAKPTNQALS